MKRCIFSTPARLDLGEIHDYIADKNVAAAASFIRQLEQICEGLVKLPEQGRKRDELAPDLRSITVERYVIFYQIVEDGVEIVRVLHSARNIERIFAVDE